MAKILRKSIVISSALLFVLVAHAEEQNLPSPGSYGFDWLSPNKARCQKITAQWLEKFRQCEYKNPGGFGLGHPSHRCRITKKSEYIVFADKATCVDELETMKANAP